MSDYYGHKAIDKIHKVLFEYLGRRNARPESLALDWAQTPDEEQEGIAETVFQYIQDLADREVYSVQMRIYRDIARKLRDAMLE